MTSEAEHFQVEVTSWEEDEDWGYPRSGSDGSGNVAESDGAMVLRQAGGPIVCEQRGDRKRLQIDESRPVTVRLPQYRLAACCCVCGRRRQTAGSLGSLYDNSGFASIADVMEEVLGLVVVRSSNDNENVLCVGCRGHLLALHTMRSWLTTLQKRYVRMVVRTNVGRRSAKVMIPKRYRQLDFFRTEKPTLGKFVQRNVRRLSDDKLIEKVYQSGTEMDGECFCRWNAKRTKSSVSDSTSNAAACVDASMQSIDTKTTTASTNGSALYSRVEIAADTVSETVNPETSTKSLRELTGIQASDMTQSETILGTSHSVAASPSQMPCPANTSTASSRTGAALRPLAPVSGESKKKLNAAHSNMPSKLIFLSQTSGITHCLPGGSAKPDSSRTSHSTNSHAELFEEINSSDLLVLRRESAGTASMEYDIKADKTTAKPVRIAPKLPQNKLKKVAACPVPSQPQQIVLNILPVVPAVAHSPLNVKSHASTPRNDGAKLRRLAPNPSDDRASSASTRSDASRSGAPVEQIMLSTTQASSSRCFASSGVADERMVEHVSGKQFRPVRHPQASVSHSKEEAGVYTEPVICYNPDGSIPPVSYQQEQTPHATAGIEAAASPRTDADYPQLHALELAAAQLRQQQQLVEQQPQRRHQLPVEGCVQESADLEPMPVDQYSNYSEVMCAQTEHVPALSRNCTVKGGRQAALAANDESYRLLPPTCKLCNQHLALDMQATRGHLMNEHMDLSRDGVLGSTKYICTGCKHQTTSLHALTRHYETRHLSRSAFVCDQCGWRFAKAEQLQAHAKHTHRTAGRVRCVYCGVTYNSQRTMQAHQNRMHPGMEDISEARVHVPVQVVVPPPSGT